MPSGLPNGVTIREAAPEDAPALLEYMARLLQEADIDVPLAADEFTYTVTQEAEIIDGFAKADNCLFLVALDAGQAVGVLTLRGGRRAATQHSANLGITVARGYRGQGIGSALMARAIAWARESGALKRIDLEVYARNEGARRLYERFGFEIEGRRRRVIFQGGEYLDDYCMGLLL